MRADPWMKCRPMKQSNISKHGFGVYWAWRFAAELQGEARRIKAITAPPTLTASPGMKIPRWINYVAYKPKP